MVQKKNRGEQQLDKKFVLFMSHAYTDLKLAELLKREISACFPNAEVFVSSDPGSLPPRDPWVETILDHLGRAVLTLVLATGRSLERVWVWFEAGAGWKTVPKFLTCCLGEVHKGGLPAPFAHYTALNVGDGGDLKTLFDELAKELGQPVSLPNFNELASKLNQTENSIAEERQAVRDPFFEERWSLVQAGIPKLEDYGQEALKLLLLFGSLTDYSALQNLNQLGVGGSLGSVLPGLQNRTGLIWPVPGQPPPNRPEYDLNWEIKPDFRPLILRYFTERKKKSAIR